MAENYPAVKCLLKALHTCEHVWIYDVPNVLLGGQVVANQNYRWTIVVCYVAPYNITPSVWAMGCCKPKPGLKLSPCGFTLVFAYHPYMEWIMILSESEAGSIRLHSNIVECIRVHQYRRETATPKEGYDGRVSLVACASLSPNKYF